LSREITIVTPENVPITYELAGIGSRACACMLDILIQGASLLALGAILALAIWILSAPGTQMMSTLSDFMIAVVIIGVFLVLMGYFIYFESARNGQTPGKKALGLRVIREEGSPIDVSSATIRNFVRVIEFTLGFHVLSLFFIMFSPKYKRLGDYAAGTIVVKELKTGVEELTRERTATAHSHAEKVLVRDVHLLSIEDLATLRRFTERRHELAPEVQEALARQMAAPIIAKLGIIPPQTGYSSANLLEEIYNRSVDERGLL
jgi:uncharacterized RDD family membrane protein YckC